MSLESGPRRNDYLMTAALVAAKFALGPVLLPQAHWLRRTALRLPEAPGPRQGVEGQGEPKLRVLVVGDSSAAGVGMADQAHALALPLARELALREGRAVGWQLVARSGSTRPKRRRWCARRAPRRRTWR